MRVNGTFSADVTKYEVKLNKAQDGQTATFDLLIGIDQAQAESKFGPDFERLAFSTKFVKQADPNNPDAVDTIAYLQDRIKPSADVVLERHVIEIDGQPFREQPTLLGIEPQKGTERAHVYLRVPIDVARAEQLKLGSKVGQTLTVKFNPEQGSFDLSTARGASRGNGHNLGGNGNGHDAEEADDGTEATATTEA